MTRLPVIALKSGSPWDQSNFDISADVGIMYHIHTRHFSYQGCVFYIPFKISSFLVNLVYPHLYLKHYDCYTLPNPINRSGKEACGLRKIRNHGKLPGTC